MGAPVPTSAEVVARRMQWWNDAVNKLRTKINECERFYPEYFAKSDTLRNANSKLNALRPLESISYDALYKNVTSAVTTIGLADAIKSRERCAKLEGKIDDVTKQ